METIILQVPIGDGDEEGSLEVEAELREQQLDQIDGLHLTADHPGSYAKAAFSLSSALDTVLPALERIVHRVRGGRLAPDEFTLEVGLKIGGEHGLILAKGTAEANIKLTAKWQPGVASSPFRGGV